MLVKSEVIADPSGNTKTNKSILFLNLNHVVIQLLHDMIQAWFGNAYNVKLNNQILLLCSVTSLCSLHILQSQIFLLRPLLTVSTPHCVQTAYAIDKEIHILL